MNNHKKEYEILCEKLESRNIDISSVIESLKSQKIETPSWGYANSGTRFQTFLWRGAAVTTLQKIDDAAMVHKMTGVAPSVALHIPWDVPEDGDFSALKQYTESKGIRLGSINPNVFQDDIYMLGSLCNPDPDTRSAALNHLIECIGIMEKTGSEILTLWFADGTNYAGQDSLRERKHRLESGLKSVYERLPSNKRMLIEYKFYEPAFYNTDIPDWGTSHALCLKLGERAQVLVDIGHHAQGVNIEQIVAFLLDEGKLGGFHFNNRKYGDDDLIVGSVNPFELFLIFNELVDAEMSVDQPASSTAKNIAYMIDQSHAIEGKIAPMIYSVMNCQTAFAKALIVERDTLSKAQRAGDVLEAHRILNRAFQTDVEPLLIQVRTESGYPANPLDAYQKCGYEEKISKDRGIAETAGGYQ
ncbi:MAG: L-rhamnose isomerase [Candidatus Electryonea clarkiae]|nr:L-rhamnose isomerase [Candidatus Electryonea clarkiae]MDP8288671.1 L-rhamnose isomerase [Candidatus Electryonea clarkiae]